MTSFGNKKNRIWTRCIAAVLLICCVLAIVPAQLFANWSIRGHSASPQAGMSSSSGNLNIQYKFFGDNLYIPAAQPTVKYYQFNSANADYIGNQITGATTKEAAFLSATSQTLASVNGNSPSSQTMTEFYCGGHGSECPSYSGDESVCNVSYNDTIDFPVNYATGKSVTISYNSGFTFNLSKGSGTQTKADFASKTATPAGIPLVTGEEIEGGLLRTVILYLSVTYTPTASIAISAAESNKHNGSGFLGFLNQKTAYKYTGVATYSFSGTYQIVIEETISSKPAQNVPNGQVADGNALYTVGGYSQGDVIYAPAAKTLIDVLPNDDTYGNVKGAAKAIRGFYSCTESEDANGNKTVVKGDPISFPLTMGSSSITIWVEVGMLHTLADERTNLNAVIQNMGASDVTTLAGENMAGSSNITNDIAYMSEKTAFGLAVSEIDGTLNLAFKFVDYIRDSTGGTYSPRVEVSVNKKVTNVDTAYIMEKSNGLTDTTLGLENNTRDYTVVLQSDVTVKGTLNLGGYTGVSYGTGAAKAQFYIISNYVALDLNGHTLTVDGTFNSYGYIYDSVGTGKIVVSPDGTFSTQLALYGVGGLQHMMRAYDSGSSPFEDYNMPYVNATVELQSSGTNSATMYGYTLIYPMAAQTGTLEMAAVICNYYMKLFGDDKTQAEDGLPLFKISQKDSKTESKTVISSKEIAGLSGLSKTGLNIKNTFEFFNQTVDFCPPTLSFTVSATLGATITKTAVLDLRRVIFPISPLVDVTFRSSDISVGQPIMVLPGSTMTVDEKSTLKLKSGGLFEQTDKLEIAALGIGLHLYGAATKNLTGAIYAPSYELQSATISQVSLMGQKVGLAFGTYEKATFWKQFGAAQVNVYGTVEFASGTTDPIVLSGNININRFKGVDASGNVCYYSWNETTPSQLSSRLPSGVKLSTYGTLAVPATMDTGKTSDERSSDIAHYYASPLISNGTAYFYNNTSASSVTGNSIYAYSGTYAMSGSYDAKTGIFTDAATNERYVILATPALPAYKSYGLIKVMHSLKKISDASNGMVKVVENNAATYYVRYSGLFIPVVTTTGVVDDAGAWAITSTTSQCTISTDFFRSPGDYSQNLILTWNGTFWTHQFYDTSTKKWCSITWSDDAKDWYYKTATVDGTKVYYLTHGGTYS